jgi:hypothetical protein
LALEAPPASRARENGPGKNVTIRKLSIQHTKAGLSISGRQVAGVKSAQRHWEVEVPATRSRT